MGLFDKFQAIFQSQKVDIDKRFEKLRSAVSGTMSDFFMARDRDSGKIVGLKIGDREKVEFFEARFKGLNKPKEGEVAMSMQHPRIVKTFEYGLTTDGLNYVVMEYLDGPGLQSLVHNREEELLQGKRLNLIIQMAEALKYVHDNEYIHRDICPRNFICSKDLDGLKLIDFGLTVPAKPAFMQPGNRTGTPLYMAPEVVRRRSTDRRVDLFSLGVTIYQLCTFELPWPVSETSGIAALAHDTSDPRPILDYRPSLHPKLAAAVMKCIQSQPEARMPDVDTFLKVMRQVDVEEVASPS